VILDVATEVGIDAERRAAVWIYQYCTGNLPEGETPLEPWEAQLY